MKKNETKIAHNLPWRKLRKVKNKSTEKYLKHYFKTYLLKFKLLVEMEAVILAGARLAPKSRFYLNALK